MKVKDIMRTDFLSFQMDAKLPFIVRSFAEKNVNSAPVFDRGDFLGIISDKDLVHFFSAKKFSLLWRKDKPSPMEDMKAVIAGKLVRKPAVVLTSNQALDSVLDKVASAVDCIPVIDNGKVAGIVRSNDIINFFLGEFAKDDFKKNLSGTGDAQHMNSAMDDILKVVRRDGMVSCRKISQELGLSFKTTEKLCETLSRHHLIEMKYSLLNGPVINSFSGGPMIRVNENEKK